MLGFALEVISMLFSKNSFVKFSPLLSVIFQIIEDKDSIL